MHSSLSVLFLSYVYKSGQPHDLLPHILLIFYKNILQKFNSAFLLTFVLFNSHLLICQSATNQAVTRKQRIGLGSGFERWVGDHRMCLYKCKAQLVTGPALKYSCPTSTTVSQVGQTQGVGMGAVLIGQNFV